LNDLLESFQATRSAALENPNNPTALREFAAGAASLPEPIDAARPDHYRPKNPFQFAQAHYPQEPLQIFDDPRLYSRLDTDTLFYLFYYRQGTYQQLLAAKALKAQSWRFHKQYSTWFQRHEEPKSITEEYEQGTYRFFDYESTWYLLHSPYLLELR
jgi:CCR4-NOT transcription complex subunit 3